MLSFVTVSQLGNSSADGLIFDTGLEDDADDDDDDAKDADGNEDDGGDNGDGDNASGRRRHTSDRGGTSNMNGTHHNGGDNESGNRWYESRIQRAERQHREYVLCQTRTQRSQVQTRVFSFERMGVF